MVTVIENYVLKFLKCSNFQQGRPYEGAREACVFNSFKNIRKITL